MLESILKKRSWTVTSAHEFRRNKQKNRALPCPNCFFACGRVQGCPIFRIEKLLELDNLMPDFDHIWSSVTKPTLKTFHLIVLLQSSFYIYYKTSPTAWNFAASFLNLTPCSHVHVIITIQASRVFLQNVSTALWDCVVSCPRRPQGESAVKAGHLQLNRHENISGCRNLKWTDLVGT